MPLRNAIQSVQQARYDLAIANQGKRRAARFDAGDFVSTADQDEIVWLLHEVASRMVALDMDTANINLAAERAAEELE